MNTVKIYQGSDRWGIYVPGGSILPFEIDNNLGRFLVVRPEVTDDEVSALEEWYFSKPPHHREDELLQKKIFSMLELRCSCGWKIDMDELVRSEELRAVRVGHDIAQQKLSWAKCPECGATITLDSNIDQRDLIIAQLFSKNSRIDPYGHREDFDPNPGWGRDKE